MFLLNVVANIVVFAIGYVVILFLCRLEDPKLGKSTGGKFDFSGLGYIYPIILTVVFQMFIGWYLANHLADFLAKMIS